MITKRGRGAQQGVGVRRGPGGPPHDVGDVLQAYARRGVFRSFSRSGAEFRFRWLWNLPFRLRFDAARGLLSFPVLLSDVAPGSELELALKEFIRGCCSPERREHRRIDTARLAILYSNRGGEVTIKVRSLDRDYRYAAARAIHLVSEIFLEFLSARYPEHLGVASD